MPDAREIVRRIQEQLFGAGRLELIDELVHEEFVNHTPLPGLPGGRDGLRAEVQMLHAAASEVRAPVERIIVEGDEVSWRWRFVGVHTGEFMGVPASGKPIEITGNDMGVLRDGRLAEWWSEADMLTVMTQLGAIESPLG